MPAALTNSPNPHPITILVVDDDQDILRFLETVLTGAGYRVLAADNGRKAIEVHQTCGEPIHLLLTDVIMPDLTGPVVAERLRSRQPDLSVLFISGCHDADLLQRFVTRKGFALLPKPFTMASLLRGVEDAMRPFTFAA
ncbi:MAG TPA: response regulator [Bryobacteraceae bacterium]|jgi:DNA-binding NtrC family response regulator|nr:response regulator [Bryobacteraceae bacterium]